MYQGLNLSKYFSRVIAWFGPPESPNLGRLWILFWIYPALMAVFVQCIALPYIYPDWHAGGGLLIQGDSQDMHSMAVDMANEIRDRGWSAWELGPGQYRYSPVGIAAFVYALTTPALWTLIPLNAALHATAALLLLIILREFLFDWRLAFVAVLPFWLYPSAMNWYAQIHKDGFAIAGIYLFLYGWTLLVQKRTWHKPYHRMVMAVIWITIGILMVNIVRPYLFELMLGICAAFALVSVSVIVVRFLKRMPKWFFALLGIAVIVALLLASSFFPSKIDAIGRIISNQRNHYVSTYGGNSALDESVRFESVMDIINYLPRATQIALFAPFPKMWFGQGNEPQTTVMRRLVGIEMIGVYLSMLGLPFAIWRWRKNLPFWIALTFAVGMAVLWSLVVNNMGALYRYRHGFTMIIMSLGLAGGFAFWERKR